MCNLSLGIREQGILEGKEIGILEGKEIGILEGRELEVVSTIRRLIRKGLPDEMIIDLLDVTEKQILKVKEEVLV